MYYMDELFSFLDELADNNNRTWFEQHRQQYERLRGLWLDDLDRMIGCMAKWDPTLSSQTARQCVYRIYRDTRFSKDKTPYKTFFSAAVCQYGRKSPYAGYYISVGNMTHLDQGLYGGIWCPTPEMLRKLRHAIVDNIEEWEEIVESPEMKRAYPDWCSTSLKTIPKGWDRNHPQAFYLRMTNYGKFLPCDRKFFLTPDWPERAADLFSVLHPFIQFINYSIDE